MLMLVHICVHTRILFGSGRASEKTSQVVMYMPCGDVFIFYRFFDLLRLSILSHSMLQEFIPTPDLFFSSFAVPLPYLSQPDWFLCMVSLDNPSDVTEHALAGALQLAFRH